MKFGLAILFGLIALFGFGLLGFIWKAAESSDREDTAWRNFAMQHHCKVKETHNWAGMTVWSCDGFEVKHP